MISIFFTENNKGGDIMVTNKNTKNRTNNLNKTEEELARVEAEQIQRARRRAEVQGPVLDTEDGDFVLDKFYNNYMDGPY